MNEARTPPDYSGAGIVNLVQSVASACGGPARYAELAALPAARLRAARHIVLFVVDGLGAQALARSSRADFLREHQVATLSSVFPSTTASAITTFMSGLAPAQHGLTGWHMHLSEIGETLAILPLSVRGDPKKALPAGLPCRIFDYPTLFAQLGRACTVIAPRSIAGSPFNAWHARGATTIAYATLGEMFAQIAALLSADGPARYIYAYYPDLDTLAHAHGTTSPQVAQALALFTAAFADFARTVAGSDAWLLASADHGFVDSPEDRVVDLDTHPRLAALLARPLCGERRAAYGYVDEKNRPAFAAYVGEHLARCAELVPSRELIAAGWFGPPPYHPRLAARVGDYTLLMKDNWTMRDWLPGEKRFTMLGVHGGTSAAEMQVPLIALRV